MTLKYNSNDFSSVSEWIALMSYVDCNNEKLNCEKKLH